MLPGEERDQGHGLKAPSAQSSSAGRAGCPTPSLSEGTLLHAVADDDHGLDSTMERSAIADALVVKMVTTKQKRRNNTDRRASGSLAINAPRGVQGTTVNSV